MSCALRACRAAMNDYIKAAAIIGLASTEKRGADTFDGPYRPPRGAFSNLDGSACCEGQARIEGLNTLTLAHPLSHRKRVSARLSGHKERKGNAEVQQYVQGSCIYRRNNPQ